MRQPLTLDAKDTISCPIPVIHLSTVASEREVITMPEKMMFFHMMKNTVDACVKKHEMGFHGVRVGAFHCSNVDALDGGLRCRPPCGGDGSRQTPPRDVKVFEGGVGETFYRKFLPHSLPTYLPHPSRLATSSVISMTLILPRFSLRARAAAWLKEPLQEGQAETRISAPRSIAESSLL